MLMRLGRGIGSGYCSGAQGGGAGAAYLDSVIGSVCCDLDATIEESYPGSGTTWFNLITAPALGDQSSYDAESDGGFTFTGTAGDSGAYWLTNGNNSSEISIVAGAGTLFDVAHRTDGNGSPAWVAMTFSIPTLTGNMAFFSNTNGTNDGFRVLQNTNTGNLRFFQDGDSGNFNQQIAPGSTLAVDTPSTVIITFDSANPGNEKWWCNSTTGSAWDNAYAPNACASDSDFQFSIGNSPGLFPMPANSEIYSFAAGNEVLDDAKAAAIIGHLEARHGRGYTS